MGKEWQEIDVKAVEFVSVGQYWFGIHFLKWNIESNSKSKYTFGFYELKQLINSMK